MVEEPEDIKEMNRKIAAFKAKQQKIEPDSALQYSTGLQVITEMISGIIVGAGIGYILDEIFDFKNIFLICFTILGGFAGILNVSRYLKENTHNKKR